MTRFIWVMFDKFASEEGFCSIRSSRGCSIRATERMKEGKGSPGGEYSLRGGSYVQVTSLSSMAGSLWVQECSTLRSFRATRFILSMAI